MVHSSLHVVEQDGKVGDSGWLENGELGVVPEVRGKDKYTHTQTLDKLEVSQLSRRSELQSESR